MKFKVVNKVNYDAYNVKKRILYLAVIKNLLLKESKKIKKDQIVKRIIEKKPNADDYYDNRVNNLLQNFNLIQPEQSKMYFASGLSCYFNDQVKKNGLSGLKLKEQDLEDVKFIASCFGKKNYHSDTSHLFESPLFVTLLGTVEFNYGMQTFPAGIFEDVFQCSPDHGLPIDLIVGESEVDYFCRVLEYQISKHSNFPIEKKEEVIKRAKRLTQHFCNGKNRIYLIPYKNIMKNKAAFGDFRGLGLSEEEMKSEYDELKTFEELIYSGRVDYGNPNLTSEIGVAIYGPIPNKGITFIEVDRTYDVIQRKAREAGYKPGDTIPANFDYTIEDSVRHSKR